MGFNIRQGSSNFETDVLRGKVEGLSHVSFIGRNDDIQTTSTPEAVWLNGGVYTGHPEQAGETVEVFSSNANDTLAGSGAQRIRITGLDDSYNFILEEIDLNGTTPVVSTLTYYRVLSANVITAGATGSNEGVLTVRHSTTTANVFAGISPGHNQSAVGAFTVPAGNTCYILSVLFSISRTNGSAGAAVVDLKVREPGQVFRIIKSYTITTTGGAYHIPMAVPISFAEGSDIIVEVESVSDNTTQASVEVELLLDAS